MQIVAHNTKVKRAEINKALEWAKALEFHEE